MHTNNIAQLAQKLTLGTGQMPDAADLRAESPLGMFAYGAEGFAVYKLAFSLLYFFVFEGKYKNLRECRGVPAVFVADAVCCRLWHEELKGLVKDMGRVQVGRRWWMEVMAEVSISFNGYRPLIYPYFECSGTVSTLSSHVKVFQFPKLPSSSTFKKTTLVSSQAKEKFGEQDEEAYSKSAV
jgi:hypothetical protein